MPVLTLTQLLEKFINERGSAAVMKEWKELITQQVQQVEQNTLKLRQENDRLQAELSKAENEITRLSQELANAKPKTGQLEENEVALLSLMARVGEVKANNITTDDGTNRLNPVTAEFYLQRLVANDFIYPMYSMGGATRYALAQKGREYLVRNNLLK